MNTYIVKILLSSGTTAYYDQYTIENVINFISSEKGYYYLETESGSEFRYPIERTILEKKPIKK
jgi:hypothetical protein